jgi:purine-binding chemotaxis protein CheW
MSSYKEQSAEQYVIFTIVGEAMGIPIALVREVISLNLFQLFRIPGSPEYFRGVINLRGQVIPIIDARKKLNFHVQEEESKTPKAIIIELDKELFGLVVDAVDEVAYIKDDLIEQAPGPLSSANKDRKIGRLSGKNKDDKERFVFLLSREVLFGEYESKDSLISSTLRNVLQEVTAITSTN